jgi:archaeosine synthase
MREGGVVLIGPGFEMPLPRYSGLPHCAGRSAHPAVEGRACVIRHDTPKEALLALRGQADLFILENSIELYDNSRMFVEAVVRAREAAGHQAALYLPGVALPNNIAPLVSMGVDILDTARSDFLSGEGWELTSDGAMLAHGTPSHWRPGNGGGIREAARDALAAELEAVRSRIAAGTLREFAEYRAKTSPRLVEMLRHLDMRHFEYQESRFPVVSGKFAATTRLALGRPDIVRFRRRVAERYRKPPTPDALLLLPCSARKPYSGSKSHGFFARAIESSRAGPRVHEVIVTSPLGLVPRELELFYPAQHYDIPVTGHWFEDERAMINKLLKEYLQINKYSYIINHTGEADLFEGISAEHTADGSPTSDGSLYALTKALSGLASGTMDWRNRSSEEIESMARFQFGLAAGGLFSGCSMSGRYPNVKAMRSGRQVASISQSNGMLVPTLEGAALLAEAGAHVVAMSDFELTGNLFAVGVESASPEIRVGDEVAVVRSGALVASGTARMSADEMVQSDRGEAVRIRHKAH